MGAGAAAPVGEKAGRPPGGIDGRPSGAEGKPPVGRENFGTWPPMSCGSASFFSKGAAIAELIKASAAARAMDW